MATKKYTQAQRKAKAEKPNSVMSARASDAASALMAAFTWRDSREGFEYWSAIHERLLQIATKPATL